MDATAQLPLPNGMVTLVDAADLADAALYAWQVGTSKSGRIYARCNEVGRLSRWLLKAPAGMHVDHVNGDTLDNRRCNLRLCTHQQNQWNRKKAPGKSRFKGVTHFKHQPTKPWMARIEKDGKRRYLGNYATEEEAARAYDAAAREMFGEFAGLNFPDADPVEAPPVYSPRKRYVNYDMLRANK